MRIFWILCSENWMARDLIFDSSIHRRNQQEYCSNEKWDGWREFLDIFWCWPKNFLKEISTILSVSKFRNKIRITSKFKFDKYSNTLQKCIIENFMNLFIMDVFISFESELSNPLFEHHKIWPDLFEGPVFHCIKDLLRWRHFHLYLSRFWEGAITTFFH